MADALYEQYLEQARRLAEPAVGKPRQGDLRRAVSTAYYALFHFLIREACREIVGANHSDESLRAMVGRSFVHSEMLKAAKAYGSGALPDRITRHLGQRAIPAQLQEIAKTFVYAQDRRHLADYDLTEQFHKQSVLALIDRIEGDIGGWRGIRDDWIARSFLLSLLVWGSLRGG